MAMYMLLKLDLRGGRVKLHLAHGTGLTWVRPRSMPTTSTPTTQHLCLRLRVIRHGHFIRLKRLGTAVVVETVEDVRLKIFHADVTKVLVTDGTKPVVTTRIVRVGGRIGVIDILLMASGRWRGKLGGGG